MTFTKTVLDNGLRIITAPQKDNPAVTVLVLVETGSKYETKNLSGISHFLEHMCFKGTTNRPTAMAIAEELDSVGAFYNAFTGFEYTGYYAKVDKNHLDKALDVVSDIYLNQIFENEEIEREKGVVIEELNMRADDPRIHIEEVFTQLLYGDQPAGWDIGGNKDAIRRMTRDDFVKYRQEHYVASATTVVVAGAIDEQDVTEKVKKIFSGIAQGKKGGKLPVEESQKKPELIIKTRTSDQTHIALGVRAYNVFDEKRYALDVLADVLGGGMSSRLFHKIRERMGAAYYVRAGSDELTDHGYLIAQAGIDNKRIKEVIEAILAEFKRLKDEDVPAGELKKAKDHIVGTLMLGLETSDSVASYLGMQEVLLKNIKSPEEVADRIQGVTAADVRAVANDIFKDERLNLAVIGPVGDEKGLEEILKVS